MNLKALIEQRNAAIEALEKIVALADAETRAMTEDEIKQFDDMKKQISQLEQTIEAFKEANKMKNDDEPSGSGSDDGGETAEAGEARAFENYVRGTVEERADVNMTLSDNGAVIPTTIANKIIKKVTEICPIYSLATKYNIKGTLQIPYYDDSTNAISVAYATEFSDLESSEGKMLNIELKGFLAGALSKISKSLINNSQFNIVDFIINAMSESISIWIEKECLKGTTNKIAGLTGVTASVTTASATAITSDELIDVQEKIPDVYQASAVWIMSKATRTYIRKLKDGDGNYLLNKDATSRWGYTLFGKDVYTSANMDDIASGKTTIYYGDFSGLAIKISEDISIEVLREKFATQHAVGVVSWIEIDSKVENAQKMAKLVQKTASGL